MSSFIFCRRGALGCSRAHFNPRTPCGVRPALMLGMGVYFCISIHAPLAGCDLPGVVARGRSRDFNPRTPCGVRRQFPNGTLPTAASFQSTHPSRGATPFGRTTERLHVAISIHAPLAGCDNRPRASGREISISIHAPLAGCDP